MFMRTEDTASVLKRRVNGRSVHRRHTVKTDGRDLFLFGYNAHKLERMPGEDLQTTAGSELRRHPLRGEWSIYAAGRQTRPFNPSAAESPPNSTVETHAATGACEVIVYSPKAEGSLATLSQDRRRLLLEAWIDRYESMFAAGCAFVLPFENRGDEVGVTLHHPHGQIYGLPVVPQPQQTALDAFENGYDLAADVETWGAPFWIAEAGGMVSYAPRFARFPYEVWISAQSPVSGPWALSEEQADGFAHLLGDTVRRYDAFFGRETPCMLR